MPQHEHSVCRLEVVVTFLAELLEVMCDNDDPIVVDFLQCLDAFHHDLQQSLESKRQDFMKKIADLAQCLEKYVKSGKVDEQAFVTFKRYDPDSFETANPRFMNSITGAYEHAPQDVSQSKRVIFALKAINQAFDMSQKIGDFMPYPVPGALKPLLNLQSFLRALHLFNLDHP
jgi:hypothetical protein